MHIFLHEWITGGGLVEHDGQLPTSLFVEGDAMVQALACDFAAIDGVEVSLLRDIRLDPVPFSGCKVAEVHSRQHFEAEFAEAIAHSDYTLIIAPEFDDVLLKTLEMARSGQASVLGCSAEFVSLTGNKHRTALHLESAGLPVPHAVLLEADEDKLPHDFPYPAVLKPVTGAGSQHTLLVEGSSDEPPPSPWPQRLEQYCPGTPASVLCLCGPARSLFLPPCEQILSRDGRFNYRGGAIVSQPALAERGALLARRTLESLPPALGFVGVDMVLGDDPSGGQDFVIEVNPRLTTSYVGLRKATADNIAYAMLQIAFGRDFELEFLTEELSFTNTGQILSITK